MTNHELNASFLSSVEASLCARQNRNAFWEALPYLLERREKNDMYSIKEAIDDIVRGRHLKGWDHSAAERIAANS